MAVVITSEESSYYAPSGLRRSQSQVKFSTRQSGGFHTSASASRIHDLYQSPPVKTILADSNTSTAPSSPRTIQVSTADLSCSSTPASNLSLSTESDPCDDPILRALDDDDIVFPEYNDDFGTNSPEELEPPPSPRAANSGNETSTTASVPHTPDLWDNVPAADDTAVGDQPTRHVDYLSHDWRMEDIWSSWKHIVSNRDSFNNAARLENASWRTWMKAKNHLKTISPETLNWLKDCDVTWLYGPLLPGKSSSLSGSNHDSRVGISKSNSFIQSQSKKKPILKKRSMSEVMLQKSLSSSSLVKQAAAAVQAQQRELPRGIRLSARPRLARAATDYVTFPFSSRRMSKEDLSTAPSSSTSGIISPNSERKHIHFNEQVEQCIAVEVKGDEDDEDMDSDRFNIGYDSESDDGIVMKRTNTRKRRPILRRKPSRHESSDKKMLNPLPPTTLKYRDDDTPEPVETAMKHSYRSPMMSPSSSQETLRPSKSSGKMFFVDESDEEEDETGDDGFSGPGLRSPPPGGFGSSSSSSSSGFRRSPSSNSLNAAPAGMKRTESGMFMPYEEGETASEGIVGFVLDTVNTARDIAHVVWNVGWRR
ncbi:hypothetical protein M406DRAFT_250582 [Cryphonectria parasitica EP155]|uniref:Nitrogen regulatory protein areA GATA-like domain-containing protein n=1 Tax=Cryphonectria parasitica (strain ATCC 38755 / EP155) TaxID=660469 RepID=A0A9P4Y8T4_CRYP1|nr:uncharacterized protein M406DRAFT_250582 [Cryphonectria parasitica EP155]KAF3769072.1 hypothetical protein M406DRAFT_250582 [Cryphonectria parasitica EP155]